MKHQFILLLLLICCTSCFAQDYIRFKHYVRENGLSDNTIEKIYQDSKGFLWIGTIDGLNKFNGYEFEVFKKQYPQKYICDNYIYNIFEDHKQRLWISTSAGIALYDSKLNNFLTVKQSEMISDASKCIFETQKKKLLSGGYNGLKVFNAIQNSFISTNNPELKKVIIKCIVQDRNGFIWLGTEHNGIFLLNEALKIKAHFTNKKKLSGNEINALAKDQKGNIWIGYLDRGLDVIDCNYNRVKHFENDERNQRSLSSNVIKCITIDKQNKVWIGTENGGLNIYVPLTDDFTRVVYNIYNPQGLSQTTMSSIAQDNQGNMWIGTHRGGINLFSPFINSFHYFTHGLSNKSLSFKDVKYFCEDGDIIYIATDGGGLNAWDRKKQIFTHFKHDPNNKSSISSNAVLCVYKDSQEDIWVGTWEGGLNRYNKYNHTFTTYKYNLHSDNMNTPDGIWKILEVGKNNLWLATSTDGVIVFNRKNETFRRLYFDSRKRTFLKGQNITSLESDKNGNIWISTRDGGLNMYNPTIDIFIHYPLDISSIYSDSNGELWITGTSGLYKFDFTSSKFTKKSYEESSKYMISSILDDNGGNLWCGTQNGIIKINKTSGKLLQYTLTDGLQGMNFSKNACLKLQSGELLFGGYNGFNIFNPRDIVTSSYTPRLYITNLFVLGKLVLPSKEKGSILKQQLFDTGKITLNHVQSALFSIEFVALNYTSPDKSKYAYKLDGYDSKWNYIGSQRRVTFTNLDPGTYQLHVKATNNDGVWNEKEAVLDIKILPPFWKTWWFTLIVICLIGIVVYFYFNMYKKLLERRLHEKKKEEFYNMQLDFFTHISHELRTPLSLILGSTEKLEQMSKERSGNIYYNLLYKNINRISVLIKETMDFRKLESGMIKLHVNSGNLPGLIRQLAEDFTTIAEKKSIDYQVDVQLTENLETWFDTYVVEKIVLNLLHNAFKYTEKGSIKVKLLFSLDEFKSNYSDSVTYSSDYKADHYAYILVRDTGIGVSALSLKQIFDRFYKVSSSHIGSGIGLAYVRELIFLHKGFISVFSQLNKGTDIIVGIPYSKSNFNTTEITAKDIAAFEFDKLDIMANLDIDNNNLKNKFSEYIDIPKEHSILIVEDNDQLRNFLKLNLKKDYTIYEAPNGQVGFEKAKDLTPSLIITDLLMPIMSGIEMCKRIREDAYTSHIPIIMLTAKETIETNEESISNGADYYFTKPIRISLLTITIKNIFERSTKLKSFYDKESAKYYKHIHLAKDKEVMDALLLIIDNNIDNSDFNIDFICKEIGMSKTKLFNFVKGKTNYSINEFIRKQRLQKAVQIMKNEETTIADIMSRVGIQSASYFTKAFKAEYGDSPLTYYQKIKTNADAL